MCMPQRVLRRRLVTSAKPMCTFDKVLNQRVEWVAWASIQIYGARDAIDDVCTTTSAAKQAILTLHHQCLSVYALLDTLLVACYKQG